MVNATTMQVQTVTALLAQQGRAIEALAEKVRQLESKGNGVDIKSASRIPTIDLDNLQPRTLQDIMPDVAAEAGMRKSCGVIDLDKCDSSLGELKDNPVNCARTCKRKLEFVTFSTEDMSILYSIKQRGIRSPFAFWFHNRFEMMAEETPTCLDLAFRPPHGMRLFGTELAVAAYIFANAGDERECLYQDSHCDGSRLRLWSLIPRQELYDDVLNMVSGMCTESKTDKNKWWLPTTFSQMIVRPHQFDKPTMDYIKKRYMGLADGLMAIYIPMHIGRHWYLMIIDIWNRKLVYLDSSRVMMRERRN
ncbi:hypothetical protein PIB30_090267 [Stylosanthes scabra]|uniref:Ubiquitin-like protease family profile domain-containing protein n=1 Tax=Stylosanthes scabra TaxID=79078 RepID=A0ABU6ZSV0_9FABA|nr:hypothetical protein [Stylosanthes scabra]